jgi:hypothetical protein
VRRNFVMIMIFIWWRWGNSLERRSTEVQRWKLQTCTVHLARFAFNLILWDLSYSRVLSLIRLDDGGSVVLYLQWRLGSFDASINLIGRDLLLLKMKIVPINLLLLSGRGSVVIGHRIWETWINAATAIRGL